MDQTQTRENALISSSGPGSAVRFPRLGAIDRQTTRVTILVLVTGIFVLDYFTPRGMVTGPLFAFPVVVSFWSTRWRFDSVVTALVVSALLPVGTFVSSDLPGVPWFLVAWNRGVALVVIWVTYCVCLRFREVYATLADSTRRFQLLVNGVKEYAIIALDPAGSVASWNTGAERLTGYRAEEIVGQHFSCFYTREDRSSGLPDLELRTALAAGQFEDEGWRVRKDGSQFLANVVITALRDELGQFCGFGKLTRDVTERKAAETQAREVLRQEMLLKEIHHRVKNNLQVVSSLLFLQSTRVKDPTILEILEETQGRVKSIALIHEKLYRSPDLERLAFGEYVHDLLAEMNRTYRIGHENVAIHCDVTDVNLGIDTALPCGLIINELVSNALKHAFPNGRRGDVWIEVGCIEGEQYLLVVRDNGIGLPGTFDWQRSKSLGLRLVVDLTKQLGGTLVVENVEGTSFQITFSQMYYPERK